MKQFHCISGLPRAGSTLLACLLAQRPDVRAGMMTPVLGIVRALVDQMAAKNQGSVFISDEDRKRVVGGAVVAYYAGEDDTVIDTNRGWCAHLPLLHALSPTAKVICMARATAQIVNSMERLQDNNAFQYWLGSKLTLYDRVRSYTAPDGIIGYAANALREACWGPHHDKLLLVQYDTLARMPHSAMRKIEGWLGLSPFEYDFEHIAYPTSFDEFDARLGVPGFHSVRPRVEYRDPVLSLPPDIVANCNRDFWLDPQERNHVAMV